MVLRKLKEAAEKYIGAEVLGAVITVPASYGLFERQAVAHAAAIAGIYVLRIVSDCSAVALM